MPPAQRAPQQSSALPVPEEPRHNMGQKQNAHHFHSVHHRSCSEWGGGGSQTLAALGLALDFDFSENVLVLVPIS